MADVIEAFKREQKKKDEFQKQMLEYRKTNIRFGDWPLRKMVEFCAEWQEVTGQLLKSQGLPYEEKLKDAKKRREFLKRMRRLPEK